MKVFNQTGACFKSDNDLILTTAIARGEDEHYQVLIDEDGFVLEKGFNNGDTC